METPRVMLVGAGPGHPGLLTLRAVECLRQADVVLYDKLVPPGMLQHAAETAECTCVADLAGEHAQYAPMVHSRMIEAAREGKRVVRLKGGDPSIFGRAGEEAEALRSAGIPFEIVPGVTAALGAAAFAGIPLTHRRHASAVAFVTGHENPSKPETMVDWPALARFPGTLVIYMGMSRLDAITEQLIQHGRDPATPAGVVHWASTGEQRSIDTTLADLPRGVRASGLGPPAIVIIGEVVSLRTQLNWFEHLPLFGKRVLVTRPRHQATEVVERLIALGAVPFVLPAVDIRPPADWSPVDAALSDLVRFRWIVFTSANGVCYFLKRLRQLGKDLRALGPVRLAAIGPRTADVLREFHLEPDLVPERFQSEDLAEALKPHVQPSDCVLLARADRGREVLREEMQKTCIVEQIAVYSQVDAVESADPVLEHLRRGEVDYITLTSSNIARALLTQLDDTCRGRIESGRTRLVSISPVTSGDIARLGLSVAAEATEATSAGVVRALVELETENKAIRDL